MFLELIFYLYKDQTCLNRLERVYYVNLRAYHTNVTSSRISASSTSEKHFKILISKAIYRKTLYILGQQWIILQYSLSMGVSVS